MDTIQSKEIEVLIIEDETGLCTLISEILRSKQIHSESVNTLHQAEAILKSFIPSLILLDHLLPDGQGLSFIPYLREKCPHAQIFIMTAYDQEQLRETAISKGVAGFLNKPFKIQDLVSAIDNLKV
jgi:two-component system, OmpR family, response regulator